MIDNQTVKQLISASLAPLIRRTSEKRLRALIRDEIHPLELRILNAEQMATRASAGFELISARIDVFDVAAERRHSEALAAIKEIDRRVTIGERTVARWRKIERVVVTGSQFALWAAVRRWLPFVSLFVGMISMIVLMWMIVRL